MKKADMIYESTFKKEKMCIGTLTGKILTVAALRETEFEEQDPNSFAENLILILISILKIAALIFSFQKWSLLQTPGI